MKRINLVKMKTGQKGKIVQIDGGGGLERRLCVMGVNLDKQIVKLSAFVLRGPVAVKVGRTVVALGHGMASKIWVELE